jgi:hypothetical protein
MKKIYTLSAILLAFLLVATTNLKANVPSIAEQALTELISQPQTQRSPEGLTITLLSPSIQV